MNERLTVKLGKDGTEEITQPFFGLNVVGRVVRIENKGFVEVVEV